MLFAFGLERSKHKYNLTFARTKNCLLLSPESERIVYLIWSMFDMVNFCHAIANIKKYEKLNTMRKKLSKFWSINHRQRHYAHLFVQFRNSGLGETLHFVLCFEKFLGCTYTKLWNSSQSQFFWCCFMKEFQVRTNNLVLSIKKLFLFVVW